MKGGGKSAERVRGKQRDAGLNGGRTEKRKETERLRGAREREEVFLTSSPWRLVVLILVGLDTISVDSVVLVLDSEQISSTLVGLDRISVDSVVLVLEAI